MPPARRAAETLKKAAQAPVFNEGRPYPSRDEAHER